MKFPQSLHLFDEIYVDKSDSNVLLSLAKDFDAMLGVYEGFCNLKQVVPFLVLVTSLGFMCLALNVCFCSEFLD